MKKIVFITSSDIFDEAGNGGSKGSKKNYDLLVNQVGEDNVYLILLTMPNYKLGTNQKNILLISQPKNDFQRFVSYFFGTKKYLPHSSCKINSYISKVKPDIVFFDGSVLGKLIKRKSDYEQVVFLHNVEAVYSYNKVKHEGIKYLLPFFATVANERRIKYADKIGCLNKRDEQIVKLRYGVNVDFFLPVTFTDKYEKEKEREKTAFSDRILFVGSFFGPNIDGIEWFISSVMPFVQNVQLDIVGKGFETKKTDYEKNKNVHVVGFVKDISEIYYSYKVVVMPIRYGAGMKVKTAEAMMYGKNIAATNEALEGYDIDSVKGIYRCNSAEEFICAIETSLKEEDSFKEDVRNLFLSKYETSNLKCVIERLLGEK